jgi:ribosome maturation factor RimP
VGFAPTFYFGRKMAETLGIQERITDIGKRITDKAGFELVHCQIAGSKRSPIVRLFIDKPGGVTIEDCAAVSREMEAILDHEDFIPTSYVLEVSSPGIERELFKIEDFEKYTGQAARVKTNQAIDGQRNFTGTIVSVKDRNIEFDDRTRGAVRIPFDSVAKANLVVDMEGDLRKHKTGR